MPVQIDEILFKGDGAATVDAQDGNYTLLVVQIYSPHVQQVPSSLTVSVSDALGSADMVFKIDGIEVFRQPAEPDGTLDLVSVPVPNLTNGNVEIMQPGTHILTVSQGTSSVGQATFEVIEGPERSPAVVADDAPPAPVPGAIQPDGTRRWVFQDLMPTGLGSWVLPMNPQEMGSPPLSRELTAVSTVEDEASGGQFHVFEGTGAPQEWTFQGPCPSKEMRQKLEAYADLNRRWYLHDHRGRAWKVTMQSLTLEPQLTKNWNGSLTDEYFTYEAVVLADPNWLEVSSG